MKQPLCGRWQHHRRVGDQRTIDAHAITEAKFAQESSELIGVLWNQGESDSLNGGYQTYAAKLTAVFSHPAQPDLPIIAGNC